MINPSFPLCGLHNTIQFNQIRDEWMKLCVYRAYLESVAESEKIDSRRRGRGGVRGFMFLGLGTNQNERSVVAENNKGFCYNINRPPMMMMMMMQW